MVTLPKPFSDLPRSKLLFENPPCIEKMSRLTESLNCGATFWIKREDCNSGLAFGGNKVRKMEYVLPDALEQGADTLVTTGGLQSNHMRQVAAVAARFGLKTTLLPLDVVDSDDPEYQKLGNIQINSLLSAENKPKTSVEQALSDIKADGGNPYFIPAGASTHPLGGLGFARWAFEVEQQEEEMGVVFDTIIVPLASGSTLGGMVTGFKLAEKKSKKSRKLIGISAMPKPDGETAKLVLQIAQTTAEKIGLTVDEISASDFVVDENYTAGKYGKLDNLTRESIKELASLEGILTDPVYTGKALAGLLSKARKGDFKDSKNVLFCHTGGQASLSAYPSLT